jgi:hypothetical protein
MEIDRKKFSDEFIRKKLLERTSRKGFYNAKMFYWDCITSHGNKYFDPKVTSDSETPDESEIDDLYKYFLPQSEVNEFCSVCNKKLTNSEACKFCNIKAPKLGYLESKNLNTNIYGFNRTFIAPSSDKVSERFSELQTWVTADPKEMEIKKIGETILETLLALNYTEADQIIKTAINMYWNIMEYYSPENGNPLGIQINRGNLKKGYIILCIWYSLVYYKQKMTLERLVRAFPNGSMSYIPDAKKNILLIFKDYPGYEFLYDETEPVYITNLCNLIDILPLKYTNKINSIKRKLISAGVFGKVLSPVQIAACIYYVCNVDILPGTKRLEIILPETGAITKITQAFLSTKCGSFSSSTLSNQVNIVANYLKK